MMRFLISLILLCACVDGFSAGTKAQELFPQQDAQRLAIGALRLSAARQANPKADLALAKALYQTRQKENSREACRLFEGTSARGLVEATAWLGICYINGRGVEKRDLARGASLIQAAAAADDAVGLVFLGMLHRRGRAVARDYDKAAELFTRAVSKGYAPAYARLGGLYMRGHGVKPDMGKAFELFKEGAQKGDPWSQLRLGQLAFNGLVGRQGELLRLRSRSPNYEMAFQLFEQAAAQGIKPAIFRIAQMYENQLGVAQDLKKAGKYYREAARAGDRRAQVAVGRLSEKQGPRGPLYSYAWYSLAIRQGDVRAKEHLDTLVGKMTPEQMRQAEEMLAYWETIHYCYGCRQEQPASR
jgi:TPR repeat protein